METPSGTSVWYQQVFSNILSLMQFYTRARAADPVTYHQKDKDSSLIYSGDCTLLSRPERLKEATGGKGVWNQVQ